MNKFATAPAVAFLFTVRTYRKDLLKEIYAIIIAIIIAVVYSNYN